MPVDDDGVGVGGTPTRAATATAGCVRYVYIYTHTYIYIYSHAMFQWPARARVRRRSHDAASSSPPSPGHKDAAAREDDASSAASDATQAQARSGSNSRARIRVVGAGASSAASSDDATGPRESPPRTRARTRQRRHSGNRDCGAEEDAGTSVCVITRGGGARGGCRDVVPMCADDDHGTAAAAAACGMIRTPRASEAFTAPNPGGSDRASGLPRDVVVEIVRALGRERDVAACAMTCKAFWSATQSERVWRDLLASKLGMEAEVLLPERLAGERRRETDTREAPRWMLKYKSWYKPEPQSLAWSSTTRDYGLAPAESKYAARYLHRCTAVGDRSKILFFGGQGGGSDFYNDLHLLDLNQRNDGLQLKQLHVGSSHEPPFPRCSGTLTAMSVNGCDDSEVVALFGGSQGFFEGFSNSLRILCADDGTRVGDAATTGAGLTWHEPIVRAHPSNINGRIPDARWGHSAVAFDGKLLLFGGSNTTHCFADTWLLEISQEQGRFIATWTLLIDGAHHGIGSCPPPRAGQTASLVGSSLFIFGGCHISEVFNDVWKLDVVGVPKEKLRWEEFKVTGIPPSPRVGHAAVVLGDRIILCGGRGSALAGTVGKYATGEEGLASMQGLTFFQSGFCMLDTTARKWLPVQHPVIDENDGEATALGKSRAHVREHRTGHVMMPARNGCLLLIGGLGFDGNFQNDLSLVSLF